jgi:hypothetical protein
MNTEEIIQKINKLLKKATTNVSYDRICDYCYEPYIANRSDQEFCCDNCADNNYNQNIRPLREAEKLLLQLKEDEKRKIEYKNSLPSPENILRNNIRKFEKLTIDPIEGTVYFMKDIVDMGVDFDHFSYKARIEGKVENCFALIFGNYKVTQLDRIKIKIEKLKN